ncbi:MAG: PHP domain-containing protein [Bacillota bacterium]
MHTHSTCSDGLLTPKQLIDKAFQKRLDGVALTDHDSVEGIQEAQTRAKEHGKFILIPGVEMGCTHGDEEVHILGYFIDFKNKELLDVLRMLRDSRWNRGIAILKKLHDQGMCLPVDEVLERAEKKGFIGRATIARELLAHGYVKNIKEAFSKYLEMHKPAYVDRFKLEIKETIDLIHRSDGISVIAHPGLLKNNEIMTECVEKGIMGVECYHSKHSRDKERYLKVFAENRGLIITGGSDFHGEEDILGNHTTNIELIPEFRERL